MAGIIERIFGFEVQAQVTALFPKGKSLSTVNSAVGLTELNGGPVSKEAKDMAEQARAARGVKSETQMEVEKMTGRVVAGHIMTKIQA